MSRKDEMGKGKGGGRVRTDAARFLSGEGRLSSGDSWDRGRQGVTGRPGEGWPGPLLPRKHGLPVGLSCPGLRSPPEPLPRTCRPRPSRGETAQVRAHGADVSGRLHTRSQPPSLLSWADAECDATCVGGTSVSPLAQNFVESF